MTTVGILGGGQLARMLALSGAPLGLRFLVMDTETDACAGDDRAQAARTGIGRIGEQHIGSAVRGHHLYFVGHAQCIEFLRGVLHGFPIRTGAHHDPHPPA